MWCLLAGQGVAWSVPPFSCFIKHPGRPARPAQACPGLGLIPSVSLTLEDFKRSSRGNGQTPSSLRNGLLASKKSSLLPSEGLIRFVVCKRRQIWNRVIRPLRQRKHYCLGVWQFIDQFWVGGLCWRVILVGSAQCWSFWSQQCTASCFWLGNWAKYQIKCFERKESN